MTVAAADPARPAPDMTVGKQLVRWSRGALHSGRSAAGEELSVWVYFPSADRPDLGEEFLRTARLLASITHPVLPGVRSVGRIDAGYFAATDRIGGVPLSATKSAIQTSDRLLARWGRDLALALHMVHGAGLLVRDIKPANIRIAPGERLIWAGAALTRYFDEPAFETISPEDARGESHHLGPQSDLYSLAALLYERLVGEPPFAGSSDRVLAQTGNLFQPVPPIRDAVPDVCPALEAILAKALRKDRTERYADASEFAVDLQRLLNGDRISAPIRLDGAPPFDCPACGRNVATRQPLCVYCYAETTGLKPLPGARRAAAFESPESKPRHVPLPAVRAGLGCHSARIVLYLFAVIAALVGGGASLVLDPHTRTGSAPILALTFIVLNVLLGIPPFLGIVASALCLATPREAKARPFIAIALICDLGTLALGVCVVLAALEMSEYEYGERGEYLLVGTALLAIQFGFLLGWAFVLAYCGRLAGYLGRLACQFDAYLAIKQGILLALGIAVAPLALGFGSAVLGAALGGFVGAAPGGARIGGWLGGVLGVIVMIYCFFRITRLAFEVIGILRTLRAATTHEVIEASVTHFHRTLKRKRHRHRKEDEV